MNIKQLTIVVCLVALYCLSCAKSSLSSSVKLGLIEQPESELKSKLEENTTQFLKPLEPMKKQVAQSFWQRELEQERQFNELSRNQDVHLAGDNNTGSKKLSLGMKNPMLPPKFPLK